MSIQPRPRALLALLERSGALCLVLAAFTCQTKAPTSKHSLPSSARTAPVESVNAKTPGRAQDLPAVDAGSPGCDLKQLHSVLYKMAACKPGHGQALAGTGDPQYGMWYLSRVAGKLAPTRVCDLAAGGRAAPADCCGDPTLVRNLGALRAWVSNGSVNPERPGDPLYDGTEVGGGWDAGFSIRTGTWLAKYLDYLVAEVPGMSPGARAALDQTACGLVGVSGTMVKALLARTVGPDIRILAVVDEPETHLWRSTNRPLETCDVGAMKSVVASLQKALTSLQPGALDEVADPRHGITFLTTKGAFEHPLCTHKPGTALAKECDTKQLRLMRHVLSIDPGRTLVDAVPRELPRERLDRAGRWGSFYRTLDAGKGVMRDARRTLFNAADDLSEPQDAAVAAAMRAGDCGLVSDLNWDSVRVLMRKGESGLRVIAVWLGEHWAGTDQSREGGQ